MIVREATLADYEDILAIRRVREGRDYIPDLYHEILKRHKAYVVILKDEIVRISLQNLPINKEKLCVTLSG